MDVVAPTSSVAALPASGSTSFTVSWSGQDDPGGTGVAAYTIYVSDNGGAFTPWFTDTTLTTGTYTGTVGHTYGFYSVATDDAGNVQATPTAAQATITINSPIDELGAYRASDGSWSLRLRRHAGLQQRHRSGLL